MAMTFRRWLRCREGDDTPTGELARAVREELDRDRRRYAGSFRYAPNNSRKSWHGYLNCGENLKQVLPAFDTAWAAYDRSRQW